MIRNCRRLACAFLCTQGFSKHQDVVNTEIDVADKTRHSESDTLQDFPAQVLDAREKKRSWK